MKCRANSLVGWLYDVASSLDWRVSILDILNTEREWPGLIGDLGVESWQRRLVREQLEGTGKPNDIDGMGE